MLGRDLGQDSTRPSTKLYLGCTFIRESGTHIHSICVLGMPAKSKTIEGQTQALAAAKMHFMCLMNMLV
jgi:hypothetical protein